MKKYIVMIFMVVITLAALTLAQAALEGPGSGLMGWWKFDEGSGTTASDSSGNGHNGTLVNGPAWIAGRIGGGALSFDGVSTFVNIPSSTDFDFHNNFPNDFSISAWVYSNSPNARVSAVGRGMGNLWHLWVLEQVGPLTGGTARFDMEFVAREVYGESSYRGTGNLYSIGAWHHVVGVKTPNPSDVIKIYIDGVPGTDSRIVTNVEPTDLSGVNVTIGSRRSITPDSVWNGYIDDVRIYNRALSSSEVIDLYNQGDSDLARYIRAGAPAGGDGSNWDRAWQQLPATLVRGDTYYLADGEYSGISITATTGSAGVAMVKKATVRDHGTATGWQGAYGTEAAIVRYASTPLRIAASNIIIDGQYRGDDWISGYGIKVENTATSSWSAGVNIADGVSNVTLRYLDIGLNPLYIDGAMDAVRAVGSSSVGISDLTFQYLYAHDSSEDIFSFRNVNNVLIDHTYLARNITNGNTHGQGISNDRSNNVVISNNIFRDIQSSGQICSGMSLTGPSDNWIIFNNIFFKSSDAPSPHGIHTGSNNVSVLTQSQRSWVPPDNKLAGAIVYNLTDGSSGRITANTASTITATLGGGTENDWDTGDEYGLWLAPTGTVRNWPGYGTRTGWYVINNTIVGIGNTGPDPSGNAMIEFPSGSIGNYAYNNIFYNPGGKINFLNVTHDYNWFYAPATMPTEDNKIIGTGNPFVVSLKPDDFHLASGVNAIDVGKSDLAAPYTTDKDGIARPQGAGWDTGAYEYVEGGIIYGDVSSDGAVSAYDAALAARAAVGLDTLSVEQTKKADVSGDSAVSAYDAALIAQKAVGLIDKFPVEG